MLILGILAVVAIYFVLRENGTIKIKPSGEKDAETILKLRYVNGEINDEAYEKMKKLINK